MAKNIKKYAKNPMRMLTYRQESKRQEMLNYEGRHGNKWNMGIP